MRRRDVVAGLAGTAVWPIVAGAQPVERLRRIGFVSLLSADSLPERPEAFRAGLHELGYQEGRDIVIEYRWADGNYDRLPTLLADLIRLKVDVIVTHGTPGVLAAKQATSTIPIIIAVVGDALGSGLVTSLARPGGNITGLTFFQPELGAKRLELLKATIPDLRDVGILLNSANPMNAPVLPQITDLAKSLKLELHQFAASGPAEFEGTFSAMAAKRIGGLVILDDSVLLANAPALAGLALKQRLPSSGWPDFALAGGLLAYGVNFPDMFRRAAAFVDKILKGAKPSDLPMERAAKFETIINQKTARLLGLTIPTSILARADEVIE